MESKVYGFTSWNRSRIWLEFEINSLEKRKSLNDVSAENCYYSEIILKRFDTGHRIALFLPLTSCFTYNRSHEIDYTVLKEQFEILRTWCSDNVNRILNDLGVLGNFRLLGRYEKASSLSPPIDTVSQKIGQGKGKAQPQPQAMELCRAACW